MPSASDDFSRISHRLATGLDFRRRAWVRGTCRKERRCIDCDVVFARVGAPAVGGRRLRCERCSSRRTALPEHYLAHKLISKHVRNRTLLVPSYCMRCAVDCEPEGHHFNGYEGANALKVIWLCQACHRAEHAKLARSTR